MTLLEVILISFAVPFVMFGVLAVYDRIFIGGDIDFKDFFTSVFIGFLFFFLSQVVGSIYLILKFG